MTTSYSRTLAPGVDIPLLGFGTYLIPDAEAADAVEAALRAGYRHIDTAEVYQNERGVGEGLRRGMAAEGLTRDDLFITTKLWPGDGDESFKSTQQAVDAFEESLQRLGLGHVDLYLIHAPFNRTQRLEQWRALVELYEKHKARAIGVSNFSAAHIEELTAASLPLPHANQIELHPWSQKPELVRFLDENGIVPIAYSSLVPLSTWRTAPGHHSGKTDEMRADSASGDSPFKALAAKYGVTEARLLLRWGVQNGYPVLPKSINPARMRENADLFSFAIDDEDMRAITAMDRGQGVAWGSSDPTHAT
ncbi:MULTISPECIES: aldo/keto reductase [unclassified Nonomuraea]|uniref:aldo/keto reductase family protein n=1 Tax=unclassified Nonomuraea TaxID=2593643 RepID=UPI0033F6D8C5